MPKFAKKTQQENPSKKKSPSSPMQKKNWALSDGIDHDTAKELLVTHFDKGAVWSGDPLLYLNAAWDALQDVAAKHGLTDTENEE